MFGVASSKQKLMITLVKHQEKAKTVIRHELFKTEKH